MRLVRSDPSNRRSALRLGVWIAITVVAAHSPHVILYDVLRVPDPDQLSILVMTMANAIVPTMIYIFYQPTRLSVALLSEAQFGLQVLVMSLMTAFAWQYTPISCSSGTQHTYEGQR